MENNQVEIYYSSNWATVAQLVECFTCDWEGAGSNPGLEIPCWISSIFFTQNAGPVSRKSHKTEAEQLN